jgi:hypothetical protein
VLVAALPALEARAWTPPYRGSEALPGPAALEALVAATRQDATRTADAAMNLERVGAADEGRPHPSISRSQMNEMVTSFDSAT